MSLVLHFALHIDNHGAGVGGRRHGKCPSPWSAQDVLSSVAEDGSSSITGTGGAWVRLCLQGRRRLVRNLGLRRGGAAELPPESDCQRDPPTQPAEHQQFKLGCEVLLLAVAWKISGLSLDSADPAFPRRSRFYGGTLFFTLERLVSRSFGKFFRPPRAVKFPPADFLPPASWRPESVQRASSNCERRCR